MWRRCVLGIAAKPEYATAKIGVWWDMKDCPIPEGYDARWVRPSIERAFKELNYSGPVSITAYGDQSQTPAHVLRGLSSTGVSVAHTRSRSTCSLMYSDMVEWRGHNAPPATMMIISNQVDDVFSWDLVRLQQRTKYNLFLAYSFRQSALHVLEAINPTSPELEYFTKTWGRNYPATPEYATANILVWWDMFHCPIPEGYDARLVRPSLEAAFKNLGYSGPVSITAFGDLNHTPDHLLRGLSSTGVDLAHTLSDYSDMFTDLMDWEDHNPQPANILVISDCLFLIKTCLAIIVQRCKRNLFLAYSFRPIAPYQNLSVVLTSAEWLWDSLLAVSETRRHVLQKCSGSETDRGESTAMFYCKLCFFDRKGHDYKSLDDFRTHLSSEEHAQRANRLAASLQLNRQEKRLSPLAQYDRKHREQWRREVENTRKRKAFRMGFRLLDNHLRLTYRRRAQKISNLQESVVKLLPSQQ